MKTRVAVSNFSLDLSHFKSFEDLNNSLSKLKDVQSLLPQKKVEFYAGNDIIEHSGFGLSLIQQLDNFQFMGDLGLKGMLLNTLYQSHLSGFNLSLSTNELMVKSGVMPKVGDDAGYIMYVPHLNIARNYKFKGKIEFAAYYEELLSTHPVSNESYFERASSHFSNLLYQSECGETLDRVTDGFCNYSVAFTRCLKALNDLSPIAERSTLDKIRTIGAKAGYECTEEGESHQNFKYPFDYNNVSYPSLGCQYHLKPSGNNDDGDSSFHHKRLYFGFIPLNAKEWKIAVAAIGPHISTYDLTDRYAKQRR